MVRSKKLEVAGGNGIKTVYDPRRSRPVLVEIVGEVEKHLGEVQRSSSQPPWKVRA
jgi:hypothetical protein